MEKSPFHLPHWVVILLLLFVPPVAWWHMWKNHRYHTWFPYVLWLNAAIILGFAAYVVTHFYPLITKISDSSTYIFAGHIGLLLLAIFEIVFGFYLIRMFKNEAILRRRILAIVITLLFLNAVAIPISQLIITSHLENRSEATSIAATPLVPDPTANWKTYTNTEYGYSLKFPQDGEVTEGGSYAMGQFSKAENTTSILYNQNDQESPKLTMDNIQLQISVSKKEPDESLEAFKKNFLMMQTKASVSTDQVVPAETVRVGGIEAVKGIQAGYLAADVILAIYNDQVYEISFEPAGWNERKDQILSTFKFTN